MDLRKWFFGLGMLVLTGCTQVHSEADARERASQAFQEFIQKKNLDKNQYKEQRVTYYAEDENWGVFYEWKGSLETSNSVHILIDKYGRAELHAEKP
ncbi:MAG: hypothetical protein H8K06_13175 [Nitrospira sp.]|nr:hypothetical protein [Nitrospira sp.]